MIKEKIAAKKALKAEPKANRSIKLPPINSKVAPISPQKTGEDD